MIAIMTNEGAAAFARSLSGGLRFLAWEAALLKGAVPSLNAALQINSRAVDLAAGAINGVPIEYIFPCTGSLPVKVSMEDDNSTAEAMAVDFDFNGQAPVENGIARNIEYQTVVALGRCFYEYPNVAIGAVYNKGDHVWGLHGRSKAYICQTDNFTYAGADPEYDSLNWSSVDASDLIIYPGENNFFSDPRFDAIPFFITSYDSAVTISNGMEWEYKVRVFLDNILTAELPRLNFFSRGGLEANGSLMLSFLANISEQFRTIRDQATTSI